MYIFFEYKEIVRLGFFKPFWEFIYLIFTFFVFFKTILGFQKKDKNKCPKTEKVLNSWEKKSKYLKMLVCEHNALKCVFP